MIGDSGDYNPATITTPEGLDLIKNVDILVKRCGCQHLNNTHTPYNPFMTVTVPSLNSHNREEERQRKRKVGDFDDDVVEERC